ncbi:MAG: glutamate 5-kinase [Firmicutes bacterium]|nr:glutamate 5-kinase [Bacillota bacterium]
MHHRVDGSELQRLVVKIGTSSLICETGSPALPRIRRICSEVAQMRQAGVDVAVVTSGAIGIGRERLGMVERPKTIPEKQAAAAVGQSALVQIYEREFAEYGIPVGQVLVTRDDMKARSRYLNLINTFNTLFDFGVVPIVNENDTVAVEELRFENNDILSALVASAIDADLLVLLTDTDGLYTADPRKDPSAKRYDVVDELTLDILEGATDTASSYGTGGFHTKLEAARICMSAGIEMVIANADTERVLQQTLSPTPPGTRFIPKHHLAGRKRWFAFNLPIRGRILVDDGARAAVLNKGKSLLPSGIAAVQGQFDHGDLVAICGLDGLEFARGLANYSSDEVERIKGANSSEIQLRLGYKDYDVVIHRDNLVCLA